MPQFLPPSPKALQVTANDSKSFKYKEEFEGVPIGLSFQVLASEMSLTTLRPLASRQGKLLNRKFRVVDHSELDPPTFEVYRLPDPVAEQQQPAVALLDYSHLLKNPQSAPSIDQSAPLTGYRGFQPPGDNPKPSGEAPRGWPSPEEAAKRED